MRELCQRIALACAAVSLLAPVAFANSGVQLPLSQYQAGAETTDNSAITNPGFESVDGFGEPIGWGQDLAGNPLLSTGAPDPANLPNPSSVAGTRVARAFNLSDINQNYAYKQTVNVSSNTDYVLSAYIWSSGVAGAAPHEDLFNTGDLAVVQVRDSTNFFNTAGMILEPIAIDGGNGAQGYFVYKTFNSAQFGSTALDLEVLWDPNQGKPGARNALTAQFDNIALTPLTQFVAQKWNNPAGGTWSTAADWINGPANRPGAVASFVTNSTGNAVVQLGGDQQIAILNLDAPAGYSFTGGTMTFQHQERLDKVGVNVISGSHTISSPLIIGAQVDTSNGQITPRNFVLNVIPSDSVLTLSGSMNPGTVTFYNTGGTLTSVGLGSYNIVKSGAGRLDLTAAKARALIINEGTVKLVANSGVVSKVGTLTIAGDTTPTARLEMTNAAMVIDHSGTSPIDTVRAQIASARAGGSWTGQGIGSSLTPDFAVGYAEAASLTSIPAVFGSVDATAVLLLGTIAGDTNFDGKVNTLDFNNLAGSFGQSGMSWINGDLNYDQTVNSTDFDILVSKYGKTVAGAAPVLGSVVPEPSGLLLVAGALVAFQRRPRSVS